MLLQEGEYNVKPGSTVCGSGDPSNLTIVGTFKDYSQSNYNVNADHLGCSTSRGEKVQVRFTRQEILLVPGPEVLLLFRVPVVGPRNCQHLCTANK